MIKGNILPLPEYRSLVEWYHWLKDLGYDIPEDYRWVHVPGHGLGLEFIKDHEAEKVEVLMILLKETNAG